MKEPVKPRAPNKPTEPKEFYDQEMEWHPPYDRKIGFTEMLHALPAGIKAEQLQFEHTSHYDEYDSWNYTKISYMTKVPNTRIKSERKAYPKKLEAYQKKLAIYNRDMDEYLKQMEEYNVWKDKEELKSLEKRIAQLKKK